MCGFSFISVGENLYIYAVLLQIKVFNCECGELLGFVSVDFIFNVTN